MTKENKVGRPRAMTDEKLQKLREGFLRGYNDSMACMYADIKERTFYDYCKDNPEFSQERELWKKKPALKAIDVINQSLEEGDVQTAKFVVERKLKGEWSTRIENTGKDGEAIDISVNQTNMRKLADEMRKGKIDQENALNQENSEKSGAA